MTRVLRACGVVVAAFFLVSAAPIPKSVRPNILLIVVDTLRFDAVSPETTPSLSSLTKRAVVFTHAYSTHDFTPASHMLQDKGNYEATHHVPLMVVLPKNMTRKTAVVDREVSIDTIAPTIYDFAGVDASPLRKHLAGFAPSLIRLVAPATQPFAAVASVPPKAQHDSSAASERERAMKSLGYIQ